ncbi:Protein spire-like protein 1 [Larimichthys crocea]|uniref:Protein spire-like protein 1 n=1 Tax=Larimichthys crocea TaxID=215358 RepID=A0A6G0HS47_LARCR|nr:Protein spire-like protein 1 [Larimichthys crocea]
MAKRPGTDDGMLTSPTILRDFAADLNAGDVNMDCGEGSVGVSLEEILKLYSQPINEEQAWAVCYQCCRTLAQKHRRKGSKSAGASAVDYPRRIEGPGDVMIWRDGTVKLHFERSTDEYGSAPTSLEVIDSLGVMIYKALDYGYEATEEEDECEEEEEEEPVSTSTTGSVSSIRSYRDVITFCSSHLPSPSDAPNHYQAVCRALYAETRELNTFLEKIKSAKENLRKMEGDTREPVKDLDELQNSDWARFWVQVMRDLRDGVKLKKVQERQYNPLPIEYQLTPYEMLMDDIRSKRYKLRKVMVNGDIPPRLKKSAHEIILEFIRSRPPLNPVSARKLKPHPPRPRSLHERLLEDIKAERKLRPVSPDMIRRSRLGAGKSISTPQDLFRSSDTPDAPRKLAVSTQSLASGTAGPNQGGVLPLSQRKRLLRAPTLAELDSSESDEEGTRSSSSRSTSLMEDTSPEAAIGKKAPPKFLPVSATPQPDKRQSSQRRHSIEKEAPTSVRPFAPPSRQTSKSLVEAASGAQGTEEFCYPVECLALTVEEESFVFRVGQRGSLSLPGPTPASSAKGLCVPSALKRCGCHQSPTPRYPSILWALAPRLKKRQVKRLCPADPEKNPFGSGHSRHSLRRSVYKLSKHGSSGSKDGRSQDMPELPKELTEDWVTMEICVDCKKFITEIISSSKRSMCVATKRARLNRKTQSFYMSSSNSVNFRPSERTINEV